MRASRIGIDLGGTKTELLAMGPGGTELWRKRVATPRAFDATLAAITALVAEAEARLGHRATVGLAIPGCETADGTIKNANSTWLNGRPLRAALEAALARPIRLANDANCFALSEAHDGAGRGAHTVFGVIAGTGLGGGLVIGGQVLEGAHGVAGEWGHMPLPWPSAEESAAAPPCYCGRRGCMEVWCSGTALEKLYLSDPLRLAHATPASGLRATGTSPSMALRAEGEAGLYGLQECLSATTTSPSMALRAEGRRACVACKNACRPPRSPPATRPPPSPPWTG